MLLIVVATTVAAVVTAIVASAATPGPYLPGEPVLFCPSVYGENATVDDCTTVAYDPNLPLIPCVTVPAEYMTCTYEDYSSLSEEEYDSLSPQEQQLGCRSFGGSYGTLPSYVTVTCVVYPEIECAGNHTILLPDQYLCVRYANINFPTILAFSIFLGMCGIDRFCLGYTCMGVGKLLTLGGLGVWWLVDLVLLTEGSLLPANGYSWDVSW